MPRLLTGVAIKLGLVQTLDEILDHFLGTVHLEVASDDELAVRRHHDGQKSLLCEIREKTGLCQDKQQMLRSMDVRRR